MMTSANTCHHFEFFLFMRSLKSVAVVVGILGGGTQTLPHPMLNKVKVREIKKDRQGRPTQEPCDSSVSNIHTVFHVFTKNKTALLKTPKHLVKSNTLHTMRVL